MQVYLESFQRWISHYTTVEHLTTLAIVLVGIFLIASIYKLVKSFHPLMLVFVVILIACGVFMYWVRYRDEPEFMTPVVEAVADFFPKEGDLRDAFGPLD